MPVGYEGPSYLEGAEYGLGTAAHGAQIGVGRMLADLEALGSIVAPVEAVPIAPAHHIYAGMTAYEMTMPRALATMAGPMVGMPRIATPADTTTLDYGQRAAGYAGQRVGEAGATFGVYGAGAVAGIAAFSGISAIGGGALGMKRWYGWGKGLAARSGLTSAAGGLTSAMGLGRVGARVAGVAGGAAMAAGAFLLPTMAIDSFAENLMEDVRDRSEITNYLQNSSFRYMGGQGFNRDERADIATQMSNMATQDYRYSMGDLKGILQSGTQLGLFEGTRDVQDFQKKFKDLTTHLSTITKMLHQSLSEGLQTIKVLKDMGYVTPQQQMQAVLGSSILGSAAGMTGTEMLAVGAQGAQTLLGTGISMQAGSQAAQMGMFGIKSMLSSGIISAEDIAHAGGAEALTQRMTMGGLQFAQSAAGRGLLMGMTRGGEVDLTNLEDFASGQKSIWQMYGQGAGEMGSAQNYMKYVLNQPENISKLMGAFGGMGGLVAQGALGMQYAKGIQGYFGGDMNTAFRYVMQEVFKMPAPEVKTLMGMMEHPEALDKKYMEGLNAEARKFLYEKTIEQHSVGGEIRRAFGGFTLRGMADSIGRWTDGVAQSWEDFYLDHTGVGRAITISGNATDPNYYLRSLASDRYGARDAAQGDLARNQGAVRRRTVTGGADTLLPSSLTSVAGVSVLGRGIFREDLGQNIIAAARRGDINAKILDEREIPKDRRGDYVQVESNWLSPDKYVSRSDLENTVRRAQGIKLTPGSFQKLATEASETAKKLADDPAAVARLAKVKSQRDMTPDEIKADRGPGALGRFIGQVIGSDWRQYAGVLTPEASSALEQHKITTDQLGLESFTKEGQEFIGLQARRAGRAQLVVTQLDMVRDMSMTTYRGQRDAQQTKEQAQTALRSFMDSNVRTGTAKNDALTAAIAGGKGELRNILAATAEGAPAGVDPLIWRQQQAIALEKELIKTGTDVGDPAYVGKTLTHTLTTMSEEKRREFLNRIGDVESKERVEADTARAKIRLTADDQFKKGLEGLALTRRGEKADAGRDDARLAGRRAVADAYTKITSAIDSHKDLAQEDIDTFLKASDVKNDPELRKYTKHFRDTLTGVKELEKLGAKGLSESALRTEVGKTLVRQGIDTKGLDEVFKSHRVEGGGLDTTGLLKDLEKSLVEGKRLGGLQGTGGSQTTGEGMQRIGEFAEVVKKQTDEINSLLKVLVGFREQLQGKKGFSVSVGFGS